MEFMMKLMKSARLAQTWQLAINLRKPCAQHFMKSTVNQPDNQKNFFNDKDEKKFLDWFWTGSNGNNLVKKLNACPVEKRFGDSIRREKERPVIYALVLNDGDFPFKHGDDQWKLCKVGFTHRNRVEQVKKQIESRYKESQGSDAKASVVFSSPIGAVDTTPFHKTKRRIQKKVGKPVRKEKAKEIGLPVPTEWVLTTQSHIDKISRRIEDRRRRYGYGEEIDIFSAKLPPDEKLNAAPDPPKQYKKDWCE